MGRRKKCVTEDDLRCMEIVAQHIKDLIEERGTSQKALADAIGIAESSLRNYIHVKSAMSNSVVELFVKSTGYIREYWLGITDCKTWREYYAEVEEAELAGAAEYWADIEKTLEERTQLFSLLGFSFVDRGARADFDFEGVAGTGTEKSVNCGRPYIIRGKNQDPAEAAYLTEEELNQLRETLQGVVWAAYYKRKWEEQKHGND